MGYAVGAERIQRADKAGCLAEQGVATVQQHLAGKLVCLLCAGGGDEIVCRLVETVLLCHPLFQQVTEFRISFCDVVLQRQERILLEQFCRDLPDGVSRKRLRRRAAGGKRDHTGHTGEFQNFTDRRGLQCVNIFCKFVLHGYILPFGQRFDRIRYLSAAQDFRQHCTKVCAVLSLEPLCRLSIPPRAALPLYYNTYFRFRQHKFFYPVQKIMRTGEKLCFESNRSGKALRCCWHLP